MNGSNNPPPPSSPGDSSDDARMDDMLIHGARDYNLPGAVPREEIWAKISETRRAKAHESGVVSTVAPTKRRSIWFAPGIGIAAALLISTGIVIGRHMDASRDSASATQARPAQTTASTTPSAAATRTAKSATPANHDTLQEQVHQETRRTSEAARALAAADVRDSSNASDLSRDPQRRRTANLAYQLVVMRHLAGAEAMITSFQNSARRGVRDSTMAEWSRELLSTTRTLEAARATSDPTMRRLLDDLDLVLSQIVQYTTKGTTDPDELNLIEQSINRRGVIAKLRSTLPDRQLPAGT